METPREFVHLAHCFHQDMFLNASTEEGIVANALRCLRKPEQLVVKGFLTELLARNPAGAELQGIWNATGPDWGFPDDEGLRKFLTMIRDKIA
jgi:hypothetical protein